MRYGIDTDCTAHLITHFVNTSLKTLRNDINIYVTHNMPRIKKVNADFFNQLDVMPEIYIKEIVSGIRKFDKMVILLACISQGIHAMLLLHKNYWTTRCGQDYSMTHIKLAYVGSGKFFVPVHLEDKADFVDKADVSDKATEPPTESDHDDLSDGMEEDLAETGLLPSDDEMQGHNNLDADDASSTLTTDSRANDFVDESMDFLQAAEPGKVAHTDTDKIDTGIADTSTENSLNNPEAQTLTPALHETDLQNEHSLNNKQGETSTSTSDKTDSHDDDDGYGSEDHDSDDSDVILIGITVPDKPLGSIAGIVHRSQSYKCYLCGFQSEMQVTFVTHFSSQHQGMPFQCDFCQGSFKTCNGLFKHERSHQYLQYKCDLCEHKTQFPYQMKAHHRVHSGQGLLQCDLCQQKFTCKSLKIAHQKMHTTKLTCNQCQLGTSKVYTSPNSLRLHTHGKHGPG